MSNKKKWIKILSDVDVFRIIVEMEDQEVPMSGAWGVRSFYENLIATGKLRVVDEVELVTKEPARQFYHPPFYCSGCGRRVTYYDEDGQDPPAAKYCPGCGNKIKRP